MSHSKPLMNVEDTVFTSFVKKPKTKNPRRYIASGFELVVVCNSARSKPDPVVYLSACWFWIARDTTQYIEKVVN